MGREVHQISRLERFKPLDPILCATVWGPFLCRASSLEVSPKDHGPLEA